MKLYKTVAEDMEGKSFTEFSSSADAASKARTRLKKNFLVGVDTTEIDVEIKGRGLIELFNTTMAHESWVAVPIAKKLGG